MYKKGDRVKIVGGIWADINGPLIGRNAEVLFDQSVGNDYVTIDVDGVGWALKTKDLQLIKFIDLTCDKPVQSVQDDVNQPKHYTSHPSGTECIEVVEHMNFCLGNAIKYIWRAGLKTDDPLKDLRKAKWYIEREIARIEKKK